MNGYVTQKSCGWNPKNLPIEKIGTCQNENHYDYTGNKKRGRKVRLWMLYSEEFNQFLDADHSKMNWDELDKLYDEIENRKWLPDSERYYCEDCCEAETE